MKAIYLLVTEDSASCPYNQCSIDGLKHNALQFLADYTLNLGRESIRPGDLTTRPVGTLSIALIANLTLRLANMYR